MRRLKTNLVFNTLNHHQAKLEEKDVDEARTYFDSISSVRFKTKIQSVEDINILTNGRKVGVRVYRPKKVTSSAVVYFHGGGWVVGSINSHDEVARLLCKYTNSTVLSVDYRLAPEHHYPSQSEDGLAVIEKLMNQGLNIPFTNLFLAGDSAGGQIALDVALKSSKAVGKNIKGLLLIYPALDPSLKTKSMEQFAEGHFVTKKNMQDFWKLYLGTQRYDWPLDGKGLAKLPPILIQTAQYDILRDEAYQFAEQLRKAGSIVEYRNYGASTHGMMQIPSVLSDRAKALRDARNFLNRLKV